MAVAAVAGLSGDPLRYASALPPVSLGWALFHMPVAMGDLSNTAVAAVSKTTNGRDVRVSIRRLAPPPASSCLQLHTDDEVFRKPSIVAADGNYLLIHMVVAVKGRPKIKFPHNFFVFKADPEFPWMQSLPPCIAKKKKSLPPCDWLAHGKDTGIARSSKGFVVANLKTSSIINKTTMREVEVAIVWLYRSTTEKWETKQLDMPYNPEKGLVEFEWKTDTVISFRGFICWVDYHHGVIYSDVFSPEFELGFHPFPGIEMRRGERQLRRMYRTVSICRGHLKFVDIDDGQFQSTEGANNGYTGSGNNWCSIKIWILKMPEFEWEEDGTLQLEDLWSLSSFQNSPLPRAVPTFPIINPQETNILHFVLDGPGFYDKAWIVTVDTKNKLLIHHALYQNLVAEGRGIDLTNVFLGNPLLPVQLQND